MRKTSFYPINAGDTKEIKIASTETSSSKALNGIATQDVYTTQSNFVPTETLAFSQHSESSTFTPRYSYSSSPSQKCDCPTRRAA